MKYIFLNLFSFLLFLYVSSSCNQQAGQAPNNQNLMQDGQLQDQSQQLAASNNISTNQGQALNQASTANPAANQTNTVEEDEDEAFIPSYDQAALGSCFNQVCEAEDEVDLNKIFDVVSVNIYQPIYVDYMQDSFPGWVKSLSESTTLIDTCSRSQGGCVALFPHPSENVSATFTVWQPDTTVAEDSESILANEYYSLLGHFAKNFDVSGASGIDDLWVASGDKTTVLKLRADVVAAKEELMWSTSPPKEYNMVHYVSGGTYEDLATKCQDEFYVMHSPGIFLCQKIQSTAYMATMVDKDMGSMSIEMSRSLYKNLVIWQPVPEPGYQCLGYIATNDVSQPYMKAYGGGQLSSSAEGAYLQKYMEIFQGSFEELSQGWMDSPMMCINQKYLTRGKYGDLITWTEKTMTDGSTKRFLILKTAALGADDNGYNPDSIGFGSTNLFVTLEDVEGGLTIEEQLALCNGSGDTSTCPIWVLDTKYINIKE